MNSLRARAFAASLFVATAVTFVACMAGAELAGSSGVSESPSITTSASPESSAAASASASAAATGSVAPATADPAGSGTPPATPPGPRDQTITFEGPPDQVFAENLEIELQARASSGLPVQFALIDDNGCSLDGSTVVVESQGTCGIEARQPGNSSFRAAPPVQRSFEIESARGIFTWNDVLQDRPEGTEFQIRADVELGLSVEFSSETTDVCTVDLVERDDDHTTAIVDLDRAGTCTITATQNESQNYFAGNPISKSFNVLAASSAP